MAKQSATELLRKYAEIVSESEGGYKAGPDFAEKAADQVTEGSEQQVSELFRHLVLAATQQDIENCSAIVDEIHTLLGDGAEEEDY